MKKIPTLFERVFEDHKKVSIKPDVRKGMEWVLAGEGIATLKFDGSCCAIINGEFYRRYDAKNGKAVPEGAIPCCEPDPVTGHWPHWVKVDPADPADKWFWEARCNTIATDFVMLTDGTYEAVGPHFQGNPYKLKIDVLVKHGEDKLEVPRTFEGIKKYLEDNYIEGIVFWKDGEPQCKIKRSDFELEWNNKNIKKDEQTAIN